MPEELQDYAAMVHPDESWSDAEYVLWQKSQLYLRGAQERAMERIMNGCAREGDSELSEQHEASGHFEQRVAGERGWALSVQFCTEHRFGEAAIEDAFELAMGVGDLEDDDKLEAAFERAKANGVDHTGWLHLGLDKGGTMSQRVDDLGELTDYLIRLEKYVDPCWKVAGIAPEALTSDYARACAARLEEVRARAGVKGTLVKGNRENGELDHVEVEL
jgi:hypothetical protein